MLAIAVPLLLNELLLLKLKGTRDVRDINDRDNRGSALAVK